LTEADGQKLSSARLGALGERVAADWLRAQGIRVLARNFRARKGGEVDIVARDQSLLLFIEVKTRRHDTTIRPFDAVDARKRTLVERGANAWLRKLGTRQLPWRFDVIEVLVKDGCLPAVNHIRDAF
jgi:putative endonuclease